MRPQGAVLKEWSDEAGPVLEALIAALNVAERLGVRGPESILAVSDQLRAASNHLGVWLTDHPSPIPDVGETMTKAVRSYLTAANVLAFEANDTEPNRRTMARELGGLHACVARISATMPRAQP